MFDVGFIGGEFRNFILLPADIVSPLWWKTF